MATSTIPPRAASIIKALLALCAFFGTGTLVLGLYVYRTRAQARALEAELAQRQELHRELARQLPSDKALFPHFKNSVAYVLHPFIGHATMWGPREHPYQVNQMGLRGENIWPKGPGRKRILLLGDSWYFGWQIRDEERLESHLRRLLGDTPWDVFTAALPGWNVRSEASFLEGNFRNLDPDVVVWEMCPNDTWDTGGVIPPGLVSWDFSPQNRELDDNSLNTFSNPFPVMPAVMARHAANMRVMQSVAERFGITVLAAPVEIPPALWSFLAGRAGVRLPTLFIPDSQKWDRRARLSDHDSHPTDWMNERLALGTAARLAEMGVLPPLRLGAEQMGMLADWKAVNTRPLTAEDLDHDLRALADLVPEAYDGGQLDSGRITAGHLGEGRMGRHGILHLRVPGGRSRVEVEFDAVPYAERYQREVTLAVRNFENRETTVRCSFSSAAQRVSCSVPIPPDGSRYAVHEIEWRFNYDDCEYPNRCFAAWLRKAASR